MVSSSSADSAVWIGFYQHALAAPRKLGQTLRLSPVRVLPRGQTTSTGSRLRQLVVAFIAGFLLLLVGATAAQAQGNEGLEVSSTTIYAPDPELERVAVTSTYTLTNLQADEVVGDGVRSFFYTRWVIAMPATATAFTASSNGQPLTAVIEADPDSDEVVFGNITLPFNLNFQQTVQLDVSFLIPGGAPRTDGTAARINDSFLSFSIWAAGDAGRTDVRVDIPPGFTVDLQGDLDELQQTNTADGTVLEAIDIQEPQDFFGQIFGRNDSGLLTETAALPGATATIRAWPDDPEWAEFVAEAIEQDVPVIEDLIGIDWPAGDIEVIETVTPYLFGYGGWFNASSGRIEIGDQLERDLILHELSHAWFNDELIDGRWITEGLAEEFASRAIESTSGERLEPTEPDLRDPLRVPLNAWASPWTLDEESAFDYEQFHYNASWWVMRQITNDIGLDAFSDVLLALQANDLPYPGEGPVEETSQQTQWTHLFDLLEDRGATDLDDLFANYVLVPADSERLALRRAARADYEALVAHGANWGAPLVVRQEMSSWQFEIARNTMAAATDLLATRNEIDALARDLEIVIEHLSELAYEDASSRDELDQAHENERELLRDLSALQSNRNQLVEQAEALSSTVEFAPMTYDEAVDNIADQRQAATVVQDLRDQVDRTASEFDLTAPDWPASTDFEAAAGLADARLATLSAIDRATKAIDAPRGLVQNIGLVGSDPNSLLAQSRSSFEADDLDDAFDATAMVETMLADADSAGRTRVTWGTISALVLVFSALAFGRYQRGHGKPRQNIEEPDANDADRPVVLNR